MANELYIFKPVSYEQDPDSLKKLHDKLVGGLRELDSEFHFFDRVTSIDNRFSGQVKNVSYFVYKTRTFLGINPDRQFLRINGNLEDADEIKSKLENICNIKFEEVVEN